MRLRVVDDGVGLRRPDGKTTSTEETDVLDGENPGAGVGVRSMRFRARLIGGTLRLEPGETGGAVLTCDAPLSGPPEVPSDP